MSQNINPPSVGRELMRDVVRVAVPAVIMLGSVVVAYRHLGPGDTRLLRGTAVGITGLAVAALAWAALGGG